MVTSQISEVFFENNSFIEDFFVKYDDATSPVIRKFRKLLLDLLILKEDYKKYNNEQWYIDFMDALNEISIQQ